MAGKHAGRIPLIAGNWKMNLNHLEAIALVQKLAFSLTREDHDLDGVEVLVGEREGELLDVGDGLEVVEVHLPVARHERLARHHGHPSNAVRPGSALPSRYSRLAPPPVEM